MFFSFTELISQLRLKQSGQPAKRTIISEFNEFICLFVYLMKIKYKINLYAIFYLVFANILCSSISWFRFSVELELNSLRKTANASTLGLSGATHIEDMFYLFKMDAFIPESTAYDDFQVNTPEGEMTKKLVKFFTNFVKFG